MGTCLRHAGSHTISRSDFGLYDHNSALAFYSTQCPGMVTLQIGAGTQNSRENEQILYN